MEKKLKAVMEPDKELSKTLKDLSAADFLGILNKDVEMRELGPILADKKKYELWVEEVHFDKITLKELREKLKGEKKKIELEPWISPNIRVNPPLGGTEYTKLVEDIAATVEARLKSK